MSGLFRRGAITGLFLAMAMLVGSGPLASTVEANRGRSGKPKIHREHHSPKKHPRRTHHKKYRRRAVAHANHPVIIRRYHPRPVVIRAARPWYVATPRVYVASSPFYYHAGLSVYLGGAHLGFEFTNAVPMGYAYYDPYCHREFYSVAAYHNHLGYHPHTPALEVVRVCGY